jgi:Protein of unknown function (DUF3298)
MVATLAAGAVLAWPALASADNPQLCDPALIDSNQMCHFDASGVYSDITMIFPANYPDEPSILAYLNKMLNEYGNDSGTATSRTGANSLNVTATRYSSGTPQARTQSVILENNQILSTAAHPATWYKSFNYNLATNMPITFDTLFVPGSKPLEAIYPIVQQSIAQQFGPTVSVPQDIGMNPAVYQNFAITNDSVIFFFDRGAFIGPLGATKVSVPRAAIASMMTPSVS